jgi:glyoxylase-like metal-dependent hydrolase (beta-lactamase superfamily II)
MREVTVQPLVVGQCWHPQIMTLKGGTLRPVAYPALAMLLIHPTEGPILFDTGYDPAFLTATQPFPERFYRWLTPVDLAEGLDAASQCRARGVDPADVRHLILSHFHADHMAGTHAFPNARIHCARAGYDAACLSGRIAGVRKGILRALFPSDFAKRAVFFEEGQRTTLPTSLAPFEDGVELIGDGSLIAVELPGHCPGHWGLFVRDAAFGQHFMIADAAWSLDAVRRNVPPPALSTGFLGNTRRTRETLRSLNQLHHRNPDIRLTPCHCPERAAEAAEVRT